MTTAIQVQIPLYPGDTNDASERLQSFHSSTLCRGSLRLGQENLAFSRSTEVWPNGGVRHLRLLSCRGSGHDVNHPAAEKNT